MLDEEKAFLTAIAANPDDDTVRLAYADWLEDTKTPPDPARAEFIRLQVELARLPADAPERAEKEMREWELLAAHYREWMPAAVIKSASTRASMDGFFPNMLAPAISHACHMRRGFVDRVTIECTLSQQIHAQLNALIVPPTEARFFAVGDLSRGYHGYCYQQVKELDKQPWYQGVKNLAWYVNYDDLYHRTLAALLKQEQTPHLERLTLAVDQPTGFGTLPAEGIAEYLRQHYFTYQHALLHSPNLNRLKQFDILATDGTPALPLRTLPQEQLHDFTERFLRDYQETLREYVTSLRSGSRPENPHFSLLNLESVGGVQVSLEVRTLQQEAKKYEQQIALLQRDAMEHMARHYNIR